MKPITFCTLHAFICARKACYFFVHMKYKKSFHLSKTVRDKRSLNWHVKWKGRGKQPEEVVRYCLVTAAAAIPQETSLAKRERGGPSSNALTLAVLQTCLQGVGAKEYTAQESLRHWNKAVNCKLGLHLHRAAKPCRLAAVLEGTDTMQMGSKQTAFKSLIAASTANFTAPSAHQDFFIAAFLLIHSDIVCQSNKEFPPVAY